MLRRALAAFLSCTAAGAFCLGTLPVLHRSQLDYYSQNEKYFRYPVALNSPVAALRRDGMGKGYFGASRGGKRTHEGVDLAIAPRMPVFAAKSGRVVFSGPGKGYGKYVEIAHPDGRSTRYAHLSELCVQKSDWVSRGQVLGTSGKTGNAADKRIRPHLHFEIRQQGKPLNPAAGLMNPGIQMR